MYLYKAGTWSGVLFNRVSLFQGYPLRGVPIASKMNEEKGYLVPT